MFEFAYFLLSSLTAGALLIQGRNLIQADSCIWQSPRDSRDILAKAVINGLPFFSSLFQLVWSFRVLDVDNQFWIQINAVFLFLYAIQYPGQRLAVFFLFVEPSSYLTLAAYFLLKHIDYGWTIFSLFAWWYWSIPNIGMFVCINLTETVFAVAMHAWIKWYVDTYYADELNQNVDKFNQK
jgi:hypothetical protein